MEKLYFNIFCRAIQALQNSTESWESVQAKDFVPLFQRGTIFKHVQMACRNAATTELMDVSGL